MKVLNLVLSEAPFKMISSGEKGDEYREIKDYWNRILLNNDGTFKEFDVVKFRWAYGKNAPYVIREWKGCRRGYGKEEWLWDSSEECFVISLGNIIELGNTVVQQELSL